MSSDWLNIWDEGADSTEGYSDNFYCPYTNGAVCPVLTKGWQPQELCNVLECEQLKFIQHRPKGRRKAA